MRSTLEAETQSLKAQLKRAHSDLEAAAKRQAQSEKSAAEARAAKESECAAWKAKWKAQSKVNEDMGVQLGDAERRLVAEAAEHASSMAKVEAQLREKMSELESGKPSEQMMFTIAREQAKRDEEVGKLRGQLTSLREMLKESHKVLKHLMRQEALLKDELKDTQRKNARSDNLNVEYLKNVVVAFLVKVYGDAEDEEHIKLARVLETILHFTPEDSRVVNHKIEYYSSSWSAE